MLPIPKWLKITLWLSLTMFVLLFLELTYRIEFCLEGNEGLRIGLLAGMLLFCLYDSILILLGIYFSSSKINTMDDDSEQ